MSRRVLLIAGFLVAVVLGVAATGDRAQAAGPPGDPAFLGTAATYSVFAAAAVTNTGLTVLSGDLGLDPDPVTSITGFPPGTYGGVLHAADPQSLQARIDLNAAYLVAFGQIPTAPDVGTADLNGSVFTAGVYSSASSLLLDVGGVITLSGGIDDVFVFQAGSSLTIETGATIVLDGVQACNVYWQVGSSASLGVNSSFAGTILADTTITALTGAQVEGRLLAGAVTDTGAVTLDTNFVDSSTACLSTPDPGPGPGPGPGPVPAAEPTLAASGGSPSGLIVFGALLAIPIGLAMLASRRRPVSS